MLTNYIAIGGFPVIVHTNDMDFGGDEVRTADIHRDKVRSLISYGRENGTADGWSFRAERPDGTVIVWRYQGCGMIDKTFRYPLTDEDIAQDNRVRANETAQANSDISEFTTPESLGRALTKSETNRRDFLRRQFAKARGFKSWKECVAGGTPVNVPEPVGRVESDTDESPSLGWETLTHPMDRPAVQSVRRAVQPHRMASARYVSGHRMD